MKFRNFITLCLLLAGSLSGFLFRADGGINLDTIGYLRQALDLPSIQTNIFPAGYPLAIRIFTYLSPDYFWATKLLNLACLGAILGFSFWKNFYPVPTMLLLCTKAGVGLWGFSFSEPLFLTVLFFVFYQLSQEHLYKNARWVLTTSILLILLLVVRHTGIFIWMGILVAYAWERVSVKNKYQPGLSHLILTSGMLLAIYLAWNYLSFHSFFGEDLRGNPEVSTGDGWIRHCILNAKGAISTWNPFFTLVLQNHDSGLFSAPALVLIVIDFFFLTGYLWILKTEPKERGHFFANIRIMGWVFLLLLFASSFSAGIEILNSRLLAPAVFCFLFPTLVALYSHKKLQKPMWLMGIFCLIFNVIYNIKVPVWYPAIHRNAETILTQNPQVCCLWLDSDSVPEVHYHIPLIHKPFIYRHPALSNGYIARHALQVIKPGLQILDSLPEGPQNKVLRNSELHIWNIEEK